MFTTKSMKWSLLLAVLMTVLFDVLISSNSLMSFRLISNIAFTFIMFVIMYISILLLTQKELTKKHFIFNSSRFIFLIFALLNLKVLISIFLLDTPDIGFFNSDILIQGIQSIFPFVDYLIILFSNAILLFSIFNKNNDLNVYEMPFYALGIFAVEVCLAIYCYHLGGILGIRLGLSFFHFIFLGLGVRLYSKNIMKRIRIKIGSSDLLLLLFSLGLLMMVYIPFGISSIFSDNAVNISSAISIVKRGSLNPYYETSNYYTPIGGFISVVFAYITGLNSILLSSTLPFLTAYLILPFVTYQFINVFITKDRRIAILGTISALLMDGLAIVLLPAFRGELTHFIITWQISPATKSLYFSSMSWMWFTPYKLLGMASATAACIVFHKKTKVNLFLSGALFFLSFVNPRQPFHLVFFLIFLFGVRIITLKDVTNLIITSIAFFGPILQVIIFRFPDIIVNQLIRIGFLSKVLAKELRSILRIFLDNALVSYIFIIVSIIGAFKIFRLGFKTRNYVQTFSSNFEAHLFSTKKITIKLKKKYSSFNTKYYSGSISFQEIILLVLVFLVSIFTIRYAYQRIPTPIMNTIENRFLAPLTYLVLRYHILIVIILWSFIVLKYKQRILVTFIALFGLSYLTTFAYIDMPLLHIPTIFVVMAVPTLMYLLKSQKRIGLIIVILFIIFGVFSGGLYSAISTSSETDSRTMDLSYVLNILLEYPDTDVFCPSSHNYFVSRAVGMANLKMSSDPSSSLYLIDIEHTSSINIQYLLSYPNTQVLYYGDAFILLER